MVNIERKSREEAEEAMLEMLKVQFRGSSRMFKQKEKIEKERNVT